MPLAPGETSGVLTEVLRAQNRIELGPSTDAPFEVGIALADGKSLGLSGAGEARLRYNSTTGKVEASIAGAAYGSLGGGGSLQAAYDAGPGIVIGAASVSMTDTGNTGVTVLTIAKNPTVASAGRGIDLVMNVNATGEGILVETYGASQGILVRDFGLSAAAGIPLVGVTTTNTARTSALLSVTQTVAGAQCGGIEIDLNNSSGSPLSVTWSGNSTCKLIHDSADMATLQIDRTSAAQATAHGLVVNYTASGFMPSDAVQVNHLGTSTLSRALDVQDYSTGATNEPIVLVQSQNANRIGPILRLDGATGSPSSLLALNGGVNNTAGTKPYIKVHTMSVYSAAGVPNNANGANGDVYHRTDGGAATSIYKKIAGVWTAIA